MYLFLSIIVQMGHDQRDALKSYSSTVIQVFTPFYRNTMKHDRLFHILRFPHFSDNRNEPDKTDENYNRLWKMGTIFGKFSDSYAKHYSQTEHLTVEVVILLSMGRVIFKQYVPKKHKESGIKIFKHCNGYTYNMKVELGKDRKCAVYTMTASHATVTGLYFKEQKCRDIDTFFCSPDLFDDLHCKELWYCQTKLERNATGFWK